MGFGLKTVLFISLFSPFSLFAQNESEKEQQVDKKILTRAIISESAVYLGGMSYLQFVWYKDHERVPFQFYNDNAGYLQVDKCGHLFASYAESYIGYQWLLKAGADRRKALFYGGTLGIVLQAPIEVFDGLYEGWGFSWGDIAANTAGSVLLIGQELIWGEQIIRNKISFSKSEYYEQANGYLGSTVFQSFFYDYNGHTYWLSMNANRVIMKEKIPSWLNISVGYSGNGMLGEFKNRTYYKGVKLPEYERTRQFLLSLDIDWEKIQTQSHFVKSVFCVLNFVKVPFPALEVTSKGKVKGYWLYL